MEFIQSNKTDHWYCDDSGFWKTKNYPVIDKLNGTYEGSLFYGMRFIDSKNVDALMENGKIVGSDIVDADEYVTKSLGNIIFGDEMHYKNLKRIRNKIIRDRLGLKNTPYFLDVDGKLISQYRMSSGECMLISLLHFIHNSLIRKSLPINEPVLMLIDEVELALHPVAVSNLIDLLFALTKDYRNLSVVLTSHSPEVIRKINPQNIYKIENSSEEGNSINVINPCYPSYAIRDIYTHDGFDNLILVEDLLAKIIVKSVIDELGLNKSRLVHVLPVGGWRNVLNLHFDICTNNVLGVNKKVLSILDGDVEKCLHAEYDSIPKLYIPINSVEKFLLKSFVEEPIFLMKKAVNDKFFNIKSIDSIISDYKTLENERSLSLENKFKPDKDGKRFYKLLCTELLKRKISEETFINGLSEIIKVHVDFSQFNKALISKLG